MIPIYWYIFLNEKFVRSKANDSIYVMQSNEFFLIIIIYIDNLITLINILKMIDLLKTKLKKSYRMNNLKDIFYYFWIEFVRDYIKKTIIMS